ncbi:MAG: polysaccharide deacetylase family protein [Myxococcales bacterium]|nr:MAG: polysaccharide deacetylase family protein [Myxococcales bacterium]
MPLKRSLNLVQRLLPEASRGDVVLAYHLVGAGTGAVVDLPVREFERQLDLLTERFHLCTLKDLLAAPAAPQPRAVLTFDDAYANFVEVVLPILERRRIPSVLYVPIGFVQGTAKAPLTGAALPACTFADLRAAASAGVEIGSHGVNHLNLRRASDAALTEELRRSREVLEQELGRAVPSFCYPQAKVDARVERATAVHYESAVAAGGRRHLGGRPHRIPRFPVRRDEARFEPMIRSRLWLTEALASEVRQWRR